jgi:hypothetical protein
MNSNRESIPAALSMMFLVLSVAYAVVVATGLLTISLSFAAWANHTSFAEYYAYVFPRFRGSAADIPIPAFGYITFIVYIAVAASVAMHTRKRFEGAWTLRRHVR